MKKSSLSWLATAATLACAIQAPAHAELLHFEEQAPNIYFGGDSFTSGSLNVSISGDYAIVDTSAAYLDHDNSPSGNSTNFLGALNDSSVTVSKTDGSLFRLAGFDFGFIAPVGGLADGSAWGGLIATALDGNDMPVVGFWEFLSTPDANNNFMFSSLNLSDMGALGSGIKSVTFTACIYDNNGTCVAPANNLGQFAIDNINIPEPASLALAALGLGMALFTRRRSAHASLSTSSARI